MKNLALVVATLAFACPSIANATCGVLGPITKTIINAGESAVSSFSVTPTTPGSPTYRFLTTDVKIVSAVVAANASNLIVSAYSSAETCPAPVAGVVQAGFATSVQTN